MWDMHVKIWLRIKSSISLKNLLSIDYDLDKHLRIKISDKNCEWRFDESFIIFKFVKTKSQILVSSLYAKKVCENLVACN